MQNPFKHKLIDGISALNAVLDNLTAYSQLIDELKVSRVAIIGMGKNYDLALRCANTWNSLGLNAVAVNSAELSHGGFGVLANVDICFWLSKTGYTTETVSALAYANKLFNHSLYNVLVTCNKQAYLPVNETICIDYMDELHTSNGCNKAPTISLALIGLLLDAFAIVASDFSTEDFLRVHPGGGVARLQ